jgi:hypothetical protein
MAAIAALTLAGGAHAEVKQTWEAGFTVENRAIADTTPEQAWIALGQVGRWWSGDHTYSLNGANMTIEMTPGGCWCEAIPGGGVEHGRVVLVLPKQKMLRIETALGPLQQTGVSGALTWQITEADGGVEIVQTYNVGGASPETVAFAAAVDHVLAGQLEGLRAYLSPPIP